MTDRSMKAILLDSEGRAPESRASESGAPESRRLALVRETGEAGAVLSPTPPMARTLTLGGGRPNPGHPSAAALPVSSLVLGGSTGNHPEPGPTTVAEPASNRPVLGRPPVASVTAVASATVATAHPAAPALAAHPPKDIVPTAAAPRGALPAPAVRTTVLPGLGAAHPGPIGAAVGLVHGIASHAVRHANEPDLHQIATAARRDPARYGADLILLGHHPHRYHDLEGAGRLPSQVWTEYEGRGRLDERLRAIHERDGAELERLYRHRPIGERVILGLAAASGLHEDIARGLDHLRAHALYPARVGFAHLVRGFTPAEIVRVGAAFLPGATEPPLATFREIREAHEERYRERRLRLLRRLREAWATGGPWLIPVFHALVSDFSVEQAERLRAEIEREGDVDRVLEEIEAQNREARMASVEAAFARWQAEWESSRDPSARTPMEEPQMKLPEEVVNAIDLARDEEPPAGNSSARTLTLSRRGDAPGDARADQEPPSPDDEADAEAGAVRGGARFGGRGFGRRGFGPRYHGGLRPRVWSSVWEILPEDDEDIEEEDGDDAGAFGVKASEPTAKTGATPAAAVQAVRAPSPGAYAADGMVPWSVLTQGFGRRGREELRRAWDGGRVWEGYDEILARRGEETTAAREAEFCRRLEPLGCAPSGPCRIDPECLSMFADMGEMFTPEQWARLRDALSGGVANPLAVWRAIERENLLEAISIRGPAFLRHFGAWGRSARWNPIAWELEVPRLSRVVLDGETAGLIDDIGGALGSFVGGASGGTGGGDAMSGIGSTIGSLFGQAGQGGGAQTAGAIAGLASRIAGAFAGSGASGQVAGKLGDFARQALGGLTGRVPAPPPPPPASAAPPSRPAAPPPERRPSHPTVDTHGIDLPRALERWGKPQSRMGEWARRIVPALAAIGLPKLAAAPPHELLQLIPHPLPSVNSDPGTWWRGLTSLQGIGAESAEALRVVIENAGPGSTEQVLAAYREALRAPLERLRAERESMFTRIFRHAEKVAGATAFDPHRLPGGDPFALFALQLPHEAWRVVEEGIRAGHGIEAFRAFESAREQHALAAAAAELPAMLAALWEKRGAAASGQDAGGTGAASTDADAAGWWSGRRHRWHDRETLATLYTDPVARQILLAGGAVDGTTLAGLRARGEVAGPDGAGGPPNDPNDWATLAFLERHCPGAAPIVTYFRSTSPDAEGLWRGYCNNLTPHFERIGFPDDDAVLAPRELASVGIYLAVSPAPGPSGWRRTTDAELSPFDQDKIRRVAAVLSFWVDPAHGIRAPGGEAGDPLGNVLGNVFTAGLYGAARFAARGPAVARAAADRAAWWDRHGERRHGRWADHEALEAFRYNPRLHRWLEHGGFVDGVSLRGLHDRGEVSGPEETDEAGWIRLHRRVRPLFHLTFGRPMGRRELARLLAIVPQLRAHPDGVIREMAGLVGQARSVLGVDARTGEYLAETGDTLPLIAEKLVGDAGRWRELEAANPAREEGDPRVRIPPTWFGFVPYSIPVELLAAELERRREDAGTLAEAGTFGEAGAYDEAGAPRRRARGGHRAAHRLAAHGGGSAGMLSSTTIGGDPDGNDGGDDGGDDADAGAPKPPRRYVLRFFETNFPLSPRFSQGVAEQIAIDHDLFDGQGWRRPDWWRELKEVNPAKPLDSRGWWRDVEEGESIWIPGYWPQARDSVEALATKHPAFRPLAARFHALNPADPDAPWLRYRRDLRTEIATTLQCTGKAVGEVEEAMVDLAVEGLYVAKAPPPGWRAAEPEWLEPFNARKLAALAATGFKFWVGPRQTALALDTSGDDDAGDALRQNLTKRTYSVVGGDSMFSIAKKLGAAPSRPKWFSELRDANPHKSMEIDPKTRKQVKWTTLNPGEIINIPDEWPDAPQLRPPPGGVATAAPLPGLKQFPELPGGVTPTVVAPPQTVPAGATVDPGTILRVQAILTAWRNAHPDAASPRDFGAGSPVSLDVLGVLNARTQEMLGSFQRWSNKTAGTQLRTDGVLDPATIAALDSWSTRAVAQLPERPSPVPVPGADLPHRADPFASVLGTAARVAADVAQRIRMPVSPPPSGPAGSAPPDAMPPAAPVDQDPFTGVPGVEGHLGRMPGPEPRASRDPGPSRPGNAPPALPPAPPPLAQLPDLLQRAGAPGVPGLPGGAPHAPPAGPLQVPPEVYRRLRDQAPPDPAPSPAPARKSNDDAVAAAGLGILAALGGLL